MTKYVTTEQTHECFHCGIVCTKRDLIELCHSLNCPRCGQSLFSMGQPNTGLNSPVAGIMIFKWQGEGKIPTPKVVIEENRVGPQFCDACGGYEIVRTLDIKDAIAMVGLTVGTLLYGVDVCLRGSQILFPFCSSDRLWIDGAEIDVSACELPENRGTWEYHLQKQ